MADTTQARFDIATQTVEAPPAAVQRQAGTPEQVYDTRCTHFGELRDAVARRWNILANLRLLAFLAAVFALGVGFQQGMDLLKLAGLGLLALFIVLVRYHSVLGKERRRYDELYKINNEARLRLRRQWADLPLRHTVRAESGSAYAGDLDIFGRASLFELLGTVGTQMGEATLARWLLQFASPETVRARQAAVAELAPLIDLRDALYLPGRLFGESKPDPQPFLAWAEGERWLARRAWLPWTARLSVAALWALLAAQLFGLVAYPFYLIFVALNLVIALTLGKDIYGVLSTASAREGAFRQYAEMFKLLSAAQFNSPMLRESQAHLTVEGVPAHRYIERLYKLAKFTIPPSAQLYIPIQALTLWDVHLLGAFERWQAQVGAGAAGGARVWLETLGEVEALAALSLPAHDNPSWVFPDVDPLTDTLDAEELGHPLLAGDVRVANSVQVGPPGTFLLVTGSNMSGKSTLLRAIGANIVLAGAGGPVCARAMRLPPVELWTSMRVSDSLEQGVSYFMAELLRLKQVVDAARRVEGGERRLLYLLDEILHGTNTAERQIAARRVVLYLVGSGALGAVSTHDLTFAESREVAAAARPFHFSETFTEGSEGPQMTFSYRLKPGIATSTNALKLMRMVGLDVGNEV